MIYKIFIESEWMDLKAAGRTDGAPIDLADGFIHFSTAEQASETANKHFSGHDNLWLAAIADAHLGGDLKWEVSRGGDLFPHLYRSLELSEIKWCIPLPAGDDGFIFPEEML